MINPQDRRPVYHQVADDLRKHITDGTLPEGSALPAEADLAASYAVGVDAVRDALALLVTEGLVEKRRGHRSRVRHTPTVSIVAFPADHLVKARPATDEERAEWGLPPGAFVLVTIESGTGIEVDTYPADRTWLQPEALPRRPGRVNP